MSEPGIFGPLGPEPEPLEKKYQEPWPLGKKIRSRSCLKKVRSRNLALLISLKNMKILKGMLNVTFLQKEWVIDPCLM